MLHSTCRQLSEAAFVNFLSTRTLCCTNVSSPLGQTSKTLLIRATSVLQRVRQAKQWTKL